MKRTPRRDKVEFIAVSGKQPHAGKTVVVAILLAAVTLAVYWRMAHFDFITWDDGDYVSENPHVLAGLSRSSIAWAFTTTHSANWHPLTWLSHMLDSEWHGMNPGGHHLTNVFFHSINTILVFVLFARMTGAVWRSAFVAAVFALHPVHVESVAWIAERKDVLSTFFALSAIGAYYVFTKRRNASSYILLCGFYAASLMSKPTMVTLPFLLLLLDVWPLNRVGPAILDKKRSGSVIPGILLEKFPLLLLAAASSVITIIVQQKAGALTDLRFIPLGARLGNAVVAYMRYLWKILWPTNLSVYYPHEGSGLPWWQIVVAASLLLVISAGVLWIGRRPYLGVGWFWFLGTLVPMIGIVQVGAQSMADRYTYIPLIGIAIMIAWGVTDLFPSKILAPLASIALVALATGTHHQVDHWRNSRALFEHALSVTGSTFIVHNNLGVIYGQEGRIDDSIREFKRVLELNPDSFDGYNNLGFMYLKRGLLEDAERNLKTAIQRNPGHPEPHNNIGELFRQQRRFAQAIPELETALSLAPDHIEARTNLGKVYMDLGRTDEAAREFEQVLRLDPNYRLARESLDALKSSRRTTQ